MLDILFLALLALFLVLKLRSILGREADLDLLVERSRTKKRPVDITPSQKVDTKNSSPVPNARYVPMHTNLIEESAKLSFEEIQKLIPDLTPKRFISLAAEVLFLMVESYDQNKIEDVRQLFSSEIYSNLKSALEAEKASGAKERISIVKVLDAKIISVMEEDNIFRVRVAFTTKQSHYTDHHANEVNTVYGETMVEACDVWEFSKPKNDNSAFWIVSSIVSS